MAHRVRQVVVRYLTAGAVALALSLLAFAGASTTHAAPMPLSAHAPVSASHPHAPCYITVVMLHGTDAPTVTCKLATEPKAGGITPFFNQVTCGSNLPSPWVALYQNASLGGQGGAQICFSGTGSDNLNNYRINWFTDWTNQVSSVNPGSNGKLTSDYNGNGNSCPFYYGQQIPWINTPCPGFNDTAKYVAIFS